MKKTKLCIVSTTAVMLAILLAVNGNVYAAEHYEEHDYTAHDYKNHGNPTATLWVHINFAHKPSYYGYAILSTHGHEKTFDFGDYAREYGNPFKIPYYYYYDKPNESVVCLKNLESGTQICKDVYKKTEDVYISMPD